MTVPCPGAELRVRVPPWCSTMAWTMARPSPVPGMTSLVAAAPRKNRPKMASCSSSGIPTPVSDTESTTEDSDTETPISTDPPAGVNLMALLVRLIRRRSSWSPSPSTAVPGSPVRAVRRSDLAWAMGSRVSHTASTSGPTSTGTRSMS